MKKIRSLILMLAIAFCGYSQTDEIGFDNVETQSIMFDDIKQVENFNASAKGYQMSYSSNNNRMLGPGMIFGGLGFLAAGILTGTNRVPGVNQSPIYDINRYLAIGTGSVLLVSGAIVTIALK
jgi:hypothetical protein